jgi:hypothetical protein
VIGGMTVGASSMQTLLTWMDAWLAGSVHDSA